MLEIVFPQHGKVSALISAMHTKTRSLDIPSGIEEGLIKPTSSQGNYSGKRAAKEDGLI